MSSRTHGHAGRPRIGIPHSPTYGSWISMKQRCYCPSAGSYHKYGARGIRVDDRWVNSFDNFLADMGVRPEGMTLDRYPNPAGNYGPDNCRWATPLEQRHNRRKAA